MIDWICRKEIDGWWAYIYSPTKFRIEIVDGPYRTNKAAERSAKLCFEYVKVREAKE